MQPTTPECIGVPIPGGAFRIDPAEGAGDGSGELVYTGPNVMMGYAERAGDLALGPGLAELRTGDIARITESGLYQVVGRSARFIKLFGLRIDLQRIETVLAGEGISACCAGTDDRLVIAVEGGHLASYVLNLVTATTKLPAAVIDIVTVPEIPRLNSGKPDYTAIRALATPPATATPATGSVAELFAQVLRVDPEDVTAESTFVTLGGDSLSFVTMSARLEKLLGHLPRDWHQMAVSELESSGTEVPGFWRTLETGIVLRAIAIIFVVGSHTAIWQIWGGGHFLLTASGCYFARFVLTEKTAKERVRHSLMTMLRIAIPCWIWIAIVRVTLGTYALTNALFVNRIFGPNNPLTLRLWYIETLIDVLGIVTIVIAIPALNRIERRWPFYFALGVLGIALVFRWGPDGYDFPDNLFSIAAGFFFAFGWATAKATAAWQRALVTTILLVTLYGYFDPAHPLIWRTYIAASMIIALIWIPQVKVPGFLVAPAIVLANASLYIYLVHWQVLELMPQGSYFTFATALLWGLVAYLVWDKVVTFAEPKIRHRWHEFQANRA